MRVITDDMVDVLIAEAAASPRKRTIYRLHEHEEPVQRMVNALVPGTYITPHQHARPPKVELMCILKGRVALLQFSPSGDVAEVHMLDERGPNRIVDIAPGTFHNMVALTPCAVLEVITGPYDPATHKQFAAFAPSEGAPEAGAYLASLEARIREEIS